MSEVKKAFKKFKLEFDTDFDRLLEDEKKVIAGSFVSGFEAAKADLDALHTAGERLSKTSEDFFDWWQKQPDEEKKKEHFEWYKGWVRRNHVYRRALATWARATGEANHD